jgi:hypothetical protein
MLRITTSGTDTGPTAILAEGRLVGPWVGELERAMGGRIPRVAGAYLDLAGVTFADADGVRLLRQLRAQGVELRRASSFIVALIGGGDGATRTGG